jgi:tetratricopeptide (TPR) repeat protein
LFRRIAALRASGAPEARLALVELARRLVEPDANQEAEAWEAVAEGALAVGDFARASRLGVKAAARAQALGHAEQAATLRLRAGAYLYQAERYGEADTLLTQVVDDPNAGAARPGAGMLRALARGRALALGRPGATRKAYVDALEAQIRDFPGDPSTHEARWLLGRIRLAASDRASALALWSTITPGTPRWIDARLAIARLDQDELDALRIGNDRKRVEASYEEARTFLAESLEQARGDVDRAEVELALVRLELTPIVGHPDEARHRCEQVLHSASQPAQHDRARRLQIVALAELNRFVEAEQLARDESTRSRPADLLEIARLLDHVASDSESDLRMRRFGLILRVLLAHAMERPEELPEGQAAEFRLRLSRSLVFRGDDVGARRALAAWNGRLPEAEDDDRFLRDLADTYFRLEAYPMAIDVERLRLKRLATGSLPWFDARYHLALAEYRAGKAKDALHLIDATAILHPELGGGELRDKFLRLRQRIGPNQ